MDTQTLPRPTGKVVNFDQVKTFDQAVDYALGGYHAALAKSAKEQGATARLWKDAATAYHSAYVSMGPLRTIPGNAGLEQARELLHKANHLGDVAASGASSS